MSFLGDKLSSAEGTWWTSCASDPRFDMRGRVVGGVLAAEVAWNEAILTKQKEVGLTDAQMDALRIEVSFCKD